MSGTFTLLRSSLNIASDIQYTEYEIYILCLFNSPSPPVPSNHSSTFGFSECHQSCYLNKWSHSVSLGDQLISVSPSWAGTVAQ